MDVRILVTGKADVADLAGRPRIDERGVGPVIVKHPVRILVANHFMVLDQVDRVDAEPSQRLVQLAFRFLPGTPVDLGHQEGTIAVAIPQRFAHALLTDAVVVVPAVVEEVDATVKCAPDDLDGVIIAQLLEAEMVSAETNGRDAFSGATQVAVRHVVIGSHAAWKATMLPSPVVWELDSATG